MPQDRRAGPSAFAVAFGEKRLEVVFGALRKLSASLESRLRAECREGPLSARMMRASELLASAASDVSAGKSDGALRAELSVSMGKSYSASNAKAVLLAHSEGLRSLSSPEGLGGAIFLHYAAAFRSRMERRAAREKTDAAVLASALSLVDAWVRSLLTQSSPDDPDDPILALAYCDDEDEAERWAGKLYLRCIQLTEDEQVIELVMGSFRSAD